MDPGGTACATQRISDVGGRGRSGLRWGGLEDLSQLVLDASKTGHRGDHPGRRLGSGIYRGLSILSRVFGGALVALEGGSQGLGQFFVVGADGQVECTAHG